MAWLSLDRADSDPRSFWSHVAQALEGAAGVGGAVLAALDAGDPPDDGMIAMLLNELGAASSGIDFVFDDYHVVERPEVHDGVAFLLERLPANVHIVISSRVDPPLPLARLRARGQLTELRSADLRFDAAEAAAYLNGMMGLALTEKSVTDLDARTEGWIAALQLAALSLKGRSDTASFIATFAGNDRYVFDYLAEEVVERQGNDVRAFLLATCFLDRLSGPLCDAVLGTSGSAAMLEALHRQNLFLVALDDRRQWYRYHHLFAEVLQAHLDDVARRALPELHRRASTWFEAEGERADAIRHAVAGGDFERAGAMIAGAIPDLRRERQEALIAAWITALPPDVIRGSPELGVGLVGALLANGQFDGIEERLVDAERALSAAGVPKSNRRTVAAASTDRERLPCAIELYRAALSQVRGDLPAMLRHAQRSIDLGMPDDDLGLAAGAGLLGIAYSTQGALDDASRAWADCAAGLEKAGHVSDVLGATVALADIAVAQGRLGEAEAHYKRGLLLAGRKPDRPPRGLADLHSGLGDIQRERGDLNAARQHLTRSNEFADRAALPRHRSRWCVAMAALLQAEGAESEIFDLLDEAERTYVSDFFPNVRPVPAVIARAHIARGHLADALRWRRASGVTVEDDLSYLREFEHLTLVRLLMAQEAATRTERPSADLLAFMDRLEHAADRGNRAGSLLDIAILRALLHAGRGSLPGALKTLERAITLAEPQGYFRIFVDAGRPMADLLRAAQRKGLAPAYVRDVLSGFDSPPAATLPAGTGPAEDLSEREIDVLRLLRSDMDGPAIASELGVSLNTMRTHTKKIFEKLGVHSRRAAVRRAEELELLQRRR